MENKSTIVDLAYNFDFLEYMKLKFENKLTNEESEFLDSLFQETFNIKDVDTVYPMYDVFNNFISLKINKASTKEEKLSMFFQFIENNPLILKYFSGDIFSYISHFIQYEKLKYSDIEKYLFSWYLSKGNTRIFLWNNLMFLEDEDFRNVDLLFDSLFNLDSYSSDESFSEYVIKDVVKTKKSNKVNLSFRVSNSSSRKLGLSKVLENNIRHLNARFEDLQKSSPYDISYSIVIATYCYHSEVSVQKIASDVSYSPLGSGKVSYYPIGSEKKVLKGFQRIQAISPNIKFYISDGKYKSSQTLSLSKNFKKLKFTLEPESKEFVFALPFEQLLRHDSELFCENVEAIYKSLQENNFKYHNSYCKIISYLYENVKEKHKKGQILNDE